MAEQSARQHTVRCGLIALLLAVFVLAAAPQEIVLAATPTVTSVNPSSGTTLGGTSVTITGTNFTGATAVKFGGTNATTFSVTNSTTITAKTPAKSAGAVTVAVTTSGGTGSKTNAYTYITPPTVTSVNPSSGTTLGGTSVTISGTNFTGATAVTFGGTNATNVVITNATTITATTPAKSAGAVTVAVTTAGGTGSKTSAYTYVTPAPTVTGIAPTSGPIAGGTSVTISGTNFTGATAVTFGGANATTFSVTNSTTITATSPAKVAGGAAIVAVSTPGGTANSPTNFTYIGTLAITAAPANFSYSATLNGNPLTLTSSFAVGINDTTGSGAGWNLQAAIGVLTDAGSDTIPASNHTIQSVAVTGTTGTAPTNGIGYPLAIPTTSGKVFNAATNTGTGQATMTFSTHLTVPADAATGAYTATLTVTIATGP
ncbi:MAG: IPT/TIG domain-containing protein [Chloroflexota bacterium]|nr:IPT/TIG domain-containing protein [Chloroflexota bacterium]